MEFTQNDWGWRDIINKITIIFKLWPFIFSYSKFRGIPPPVLIPPRQRGGGEKINLSKLRKKTAHQEFAQSFTYMSENRHDVSDILSCNRGSQRRRWPRQTSGPIDQNQRGKRREVEGDGAGTSHHGTKTFGLSCRSCLLQMRTHVDVQDHAMWVLQGRSRLCVMLMSEAVC